MIVVTRLDLEVSVESKSGDLTCVRSMTQKRTLDIDLFLLVFYLASGSHRQILIDFKAKAVRRNEELCHCKKKKNHFAGHAHHTGQLSTQGNIKK